MIKFLNIVCFRWGNKFSVDYVNILKNRVKLNLSLEHKFFCLTDDFEGLDADIEARKIPKDLPGNGPKLFSFSENFLNLTNDQYVVILDLDNVIVGNLNFLAESPEHDFVVARHRVNISNAIHGTVYRLRVGSLTKVWENFIVDPTVAENNFPGVNGNTFSEQKWLSKQLLKQEINFFSSEKIILFREDCFRNSHRNALKSIMRKFHLVPKSLSINEAQLPNSGEAIVSFAGRVKPHELLDDRNDHNCRALFVKIFWRL